MKESNKNNSSNREGYFYKIKDLLLKKSFSKGEIQTDISNSSKENLHRLAYFDGLTNLPNRTSFNIYLREILKENKEKKIGVMFIDLDHFKQINDTLGHEQGDILVTLVGERLRTIVEKNIKVFRLGGDEFVIVKWDYKQLDMDIVVDKTLELFKKEFKLIGGYYKISGSLGISLYPEDSNDVSEIVKYADMAMYHSKENGGGYAQYFNVDIKNEFIYRIEVEQGIRRAIENSEFILYYQPQININKNEIESFEALLRWKSGEDEEVKPDKFIKIAEETSLILDVDKYVLKKACYQNKMWQDKGYRKLPVSVNVSPKHLSNGEIIKSVKNALEESGLEGKYLIIEITEGALIKDYNKVIKVLEELKSIGVSVSIDDFGRGYSSLSQLINLPIAEVKIDREFISGITFDIKKQMVVKLIISLAHQLNLKVVGEGIEEEEEFNFLKVLKCDIVQGYYFSKALSEEEGIKLLNKEVLIKM